ncbi:MAG: ATP-binding protein, partial [Clostridia bacterium]|nr:ATP-binding protein [Clostridia bacterium]
MTVSELQTFRLRLLSLSIFRDILDEGPVRDLLDLIEALSMEPYIDTSSGQMILSSEVSSYGALCRSIYAAGGDLAGFVRDYVLNKDSFFVSIFSSDGSKGSATGMADCLEAEIDTLQQLAELRSDDIADMIDCGFSLPGWDNSLVDIKKDYLGLLASLKTGGYGIFRNTMMFKVRGGALIPIKKAEYQTLSQLYGYEAERGLVLKNTEALANGEPASNVLLYGDAGTGKSSTVKACAAAFFDKGVRLVEFSKDQVAEIPELAEYLSSNPPKFIFFIDDLTFEENDSDFYSLKGILEGNVSGTGSNILIYATSNRRHLIKESSAQRQGDDLHLNDTLQEMMSLSARFG